MKKIILLLVLTLCSVLVFGQAIWNKKLPVSHFPSTPMVSPTQIDGNGYLFASAGKIVVLDSRGSITGVMHTGTSAWLSNYVQKRSDPNPSDPQGWSMCTANLPMGDRRMINSHGPFSFAAGDTFSMRLVFTFHPDIPHPCPDVQGLVKPTIQQIQQWYDDGTLDAPLDLGSVQILQAGQSLTLNATMSNATTYAWSTSANTPSITVNQTGEYTVTVTRASACPFIETVLVKAPVGTITPTLSDWKVQPNPAHDLFKIIFENVGMPVTALLRNAQGQTVATKSSAGNAVEIYVANLPAGLYWAELWREGQFLGSRKVVVARF